MKKKIVFMFSGQGSQYYKMGKELYENHPRFRFWMDHCNEIARPLTDSSLINILYGSHSMQYAFDNILYSNCALLSIEYSLARVLMEMEIRPDFFLGYSLGEISASIIADVISLKDGMGIVAEMAKLVERKTRTAKMLSIIESKQILKDFPELFENCWLTGENFSKNFVVCGLQKDIAKIMETLNLNNIVSQMLPVNYGFHTELIDPIENEFKQIVEKIKLSSAKNIISAFKNRFIEKVDSNYFWQLIRHPVNFKKTVEWTIENYTCIFIDVGPSGSLATFVKYILPDNSNSISIQILNQFGNDLKSIETLKKRLLIELAL